MRDPRNAHHFIRAEDPELKLLDTAKPSRREAELGRHGVALPLVSFAVCPSSTTALWRPHTKGWLGFTFAPGVYRLPCSFSVPATQKMDRLSTFSLFSSSRRALPSLPVARRGVV